MSESESQSQRLLELLEECLVEHGGDLGGWTKLEEGALQIFDGRVTLRVEIYEVEGADSEGVVHAHVLATLHEHEDEVLDACHAGNGDDLEEALGQVALAWVVGVGGPIRSFIDDRPVCMTCKAGVPGGDAEAGYVEGDYGLPGLRAYVGPGFFHGIEDEETVTAIDDSKPWFRFAAESAAPRLVHLAKATVMGDGENGWRRHLEIDGHDVSHVEADWPAGVEAPEFGYLTRFAVFAFPRDSAEVARRAELERTIREFAQDYARFDSVVDLEEDMAGRGFDPDLIHEVESISSLAFGREVFKRHDVNFPTTVIRAHRDGRIEPDVPLMSLPAFNRARALFRSLRRSIAKDDLNSLCYHSAEAKALIRAVESEPDLDLSTVRMYPCIVPDRDASDETMDAAIAYLQTLAERNRRSKPTPKLKPRPSLKPKKRKWR
ncbi:hypothetical protein [Singulisphaera sp. PoT]|uniref:hypothetical protein n=1 Tax=Singulisphaera sp. PoT TaxID=3411797 RepID=UPI003BF4F6A3